MSSTARVPQYVPFVVSVPSRLVISPESIKVKVKKAWILFPGIDRCRALCDARAVEGAKRQTAVNVEVQPEAPQLKTDAGKPASAEVSKRKNRPRQYQ